MAQDFNTLNASDSNTEVVNDSNINFAAVRSTFSGATAPDDPAPVEGQLWYKTDTDELYVYDGAAWDLIASGVGSDLLGLSPDDGNFIVGDGSTWVVESGATARTSLGLGTIATQNSTEVSITGGEVVAVDISGAAINSSSIGQSITSTGAFTTLSASSTISSTESVSAPLVVASGAGTAAAPSLRVGDAGNGMYAPATNELGMTLNGSAFAQFDTTDVWIGSTNATATGTWNVAVGFNCGKNITTSAYNVLIGYEAGEALSGGGTNVFIGHQAGEAATNMDAAVMIGPFAGQNATTGIANTLIGESAGRGITTGADNTAVGSDAGWSATDVAGWTTGDHNTAIGNNSGETRNAGTPVNQTGSNNTALGSNTWFSNTNETNVSYRTVVGAGAVGTADNQIMLGRSSDTVTVPGAVGLAAGTTSLYSWHATGDPNTGLRFPAADTLALGTGGVDRLTVTTTGSGFGIASPADIVHVYSGTGTSTWAPAATRGVAISNNSGPRLIFEQTGATAGQRIMLFQYFSGKLHATVMNDAGTSNTLLEAWSVDRSGNTFSAGDHNVASGKVYKVNGTQVVAAQGAAIADVDTGGAATASANATAINTILARLRAHGLIAT